MGGEAPTMSAPHVALFLPTLGGGGAERITLNLACGLVARDLSVDLVLVEDEGTYRPRVPDAVRVVDLGAKRVSKSVLPLRRYLTKERPATLLAAFEHATLAALVAHRLARVPTRMVIAVHTTFSIAARGIAMKRRRVQPMMARRLYPLADGIVAVSHGVADDLARTIGLDRGRIDVVYNPVITPELYRQAAEPFSHPWFGDGAVPVVLGVGRLSAPKNFPLLIRAVANVRNRRPVRLLILGEGEDRSALEALVKDRGLTDCVALPGFVDNPYVYMRRAQLLALSSNWEGLPTVLIEALACGCPVVSTDCPSGPSEILDAGTYGRLVPMGDENALAEAIIHSLDNPHSAEFSQERIRQFTIDYATDEYAKVLQISPEPRHQKGTQH